MTGLASGGMAGDLLSATIVAASILAGSISAASTGSGSSACPRIEVRGHLQLAKGALTLADLLAPGSCAELVQAAAQVSLGAVPRPGALRVLDGGEVRHLLAGLSGDKLGEAEAAAAKIPERIVIEAAGGMKDCAEIARFIRNAGSGANGWRGLNCAAARRIPEEASLELAKTAWQASSGHWEFTLHCAPLADCVPFLVWAYAASPPASKNAVASVGDITHAWLIKPGQTASLIWDERGIRIMAAVTCLDGGGVGEFVRVRFQNGAGILRAQVLSDGTLRASR